MKVEKVQIIEELEYRERMLERGEGDMESYMRACGMVRVLESLSLISEDEATEWICRMADASSDAWCRREIRKEFERC